jgi:hypothetical protein
VIICIWREVGKKRVKFSSHGWEIRSYDKSSAGKLRLDILVNSGETLNVSEKRSVMVVT